MNRKEIFLISIGIFMTVIAWLIADVYHAATVEMIKVKDVSPTITRYEISKELLDQLNLKTE